jgi:hypothetical protein
MKDSSPLVRKNRELTRRVAELERAIKRHRSRTGHDLCWENDEELWRVLGDGARVRHHVPPWDEFMTKCAQYRKSREGQK